MLTETSPSFSTFARLRRRFFRYRSSLSSSSPQSLSFSLSRFLFLFRQPLFSQWADASSSVHTRSIRAQSGSSNQRGRSSQFFYFNQIDRIDSLSTHVFFFSSPSACIIYTCCCPRKKKRGREKGEEHDVKMLGELTHSAGVETCATSWNVYKFVTTCGKGIRFMRSFGAHHVP